MYKNVKQYTCTLSFFEKPKQVVSVPENVACESTVNVDEDIPEVVSVDDGEAMPVHDGEVALVNDTRDPIPSIFSLQSTAKAEII